MCVKESKVLAVNSFWLHYSWKEQDSCLKTKKNKVISWECLKTTKQMNSKSKPVKSNSKNHEPHSTRIQIYQMPKYHMFPGFFPNGFPMVFPYFFPYVSIVSHIFPWFSHGFPMVFPLPLELSWAMPKAGAGRSLLGAHAQHLSVHPRGTPDAGPRR